MQLYTPVQFSDAEVAFLRELLASVSTVPLKHARAAADVYDKVHALQPVPADDAPAT